MSVYFFYTAVRTAVLYDVLVRRVLHVLLLAACCTATAVRTYNRFVNWSNEDIPEGTGALYRSTTAV